MTDLPPTPPEPEKPHNGGFVPPYAGGSPVPPPAKPPYDGSTYSPPEWTNVPPPPPMTGQPQGYYNGPNYPGPVYSGQPANTLALVSLGLGIAGLVFMCLYGFGGLFSIAAVVTGKMAQKQNLNVSDQSKAKAGLITGWIGIGLSVLVLLSLIVLVVVGVTLDSPGMH